MNKAIEQELRRLEKLDDLQLLDVLFRIDDVSAPKWVKDLVVEKIRNILNAKIGLTSP